MKGAIQAGYKFEREVDEGLKKQHGWYMKIPDTRSARTRCPKCSCMISSVKFKQVPSDFIYLHPSGQIMFIEAKSTRCKYLSRQNIKDHQLEAGKKIIALNGKYYFVIYMKYHKKVIILDANALEKAFGGKTQASIFTLLQHGVEIERKTARYNTVNDCAFVNFYTIIQ